MPIFFKLGYAIKKFKLPFKQYKCKVQIRNIHTFPGFWGSSAHGFEVVVVHGRLVVVGLRVADVVVFVGTVIGDLVADGFAAKHFKLMLVNGGKK